jgi:ABC-2 type transport system ATP-binding protein
MITVGGLTKKCGLTKKYGARTVVDDVSFTLEPGTVTGFLGPNGAGKTTTMRMISGLVPPTAGSALVDGRPYAALPNPGAVIGTLLDAGAVHPGRTGRTHLRLLASALGVQATRVEEVLELVGLTDAGGRRIGGYSLGMRQRLGIAGALLADPPVLMFDEPANGLDPEGIRWMRGLLRGHAARGGTVLLSSHLLGEVEHTVDRLLVIGGGRIVADGPVASLLGSDSVSVRSTDPAALAADLAAKGFSVSPGDDGALVVSGASAGDVGAVAAAGGHVLSELRPLQRGLEDVFFSLTAA